MATLGTQIKRMRRNKEYLYYAYYDNGKRVETYCGPASTPESHRKALECEAIELTKQQVVIVNRLQWIENAVRQGTLGLKRSAGA